MLLKDFLVAWYKMNDDAADTDVIDSSGNSFTGTASQNTEDMDATGKINGALDFNGTDDDIVVVADSEIDIYGKTGYSISAWIYPHSDGGNDEGVIVDKRSGAGASYVFRVGNETSGLDLVFYLEMSGTNVDARVYNSVSLNQWSHVVITYNEGGTKHGKIYVNSVLTILFKDIAGTGNPTDDSAKDLYVGNRVDGNRGFDGLIDNVMIFNKALTPLEIKYLYNGGTGTENIPTLIELSRTGTKFSSHQEM